jgi:autoinducer 2-degrading protein
MDLNVKPEMRERFLAAIEENTAASLRDEPGCLRFDMVHDNDDPNHFLLTSTRRRSRRIAPHFQRWREATASCLRDDDRQTNTYCARVFPRASG